MISELCDQCQRYSGNFIYALLALTKYLNNYPEIRYFVNNSWRSFDVKSILVKLSK